MSCRTQLPVRVPQCLFLARRAPPSARPDVFQIRAHHLRDQAGSKILAGCTTPEATSTRAASYTVGSPWTSTSRGSMPSRAGSGRRPVAFAQPQKTAVVELKAPAIAPIVRGFHDCEAMPASIMDIIITDHCIDSLVAKTRPRKESETWRSNWDIFNMELTPTAARDRPMKISAQPK